MFPFFISQSSLIFSQVIFIGYFFLLYHAAVFVLFISVDVQRGVEAVNRILIFVSGNKARNCVFISFDYLAFGAENILLRFLS
jgi:hypothetical protein